MVSATARRALRSTTFFTTLFLILSTTQMVVRAQTVTLNMPSEGTQSLPANASAEAVAKVLSSVFSTINQNMGAVGQNITASTTSMNQGAGGSSFLQGLNLTAIPNLAKLLGNLTISPVNGTMRDRQDALLGALAQAQQAGDLTTLETAAASVSAFAAAPLSLGSGGNIQIFLTRVKQLRTLRDSVSAYLSVATITTIEGYINTAESLALQFVTAFPLTELAFLIANIALGAAITSLLGGIFYLVGSALAIAGSIPAPPGAGGTPDPITSIASAKALIDTPTGLRSAPASPHTAWYNKLRTDGLKVAEPALRIAFSNSTLRPVSMVENLLSTMIDGTCILTKQC